MIEGRDRKRKAQGGHVHSGHIPALVVIACSTHTHTHHSRMCRASGLAPLESSSLTQLSPTLSVISTITLSSLSYLKHIQTWGAPTPTPSSSFARAALWQSYEYQLTFIYCQIDFSIECGERRRRRRRAGEIDAEEDTNEC